MKYFRRNKNWLRYRTLCKVKRKHPELFPSFWRKITTNLIEYAFDRNRWWLILCVVAVIFGISAAIDINFLNIINIKYSTATTLVDQRTVNIAVITSFALAVIGFLISNIAVKKHIAYELLFRYCHLYPIIYLTLGTIGCFFIVSTLRDYFEPIQFVNMLLAGTYLGIFLLFCIGYLFRRIPTFTDPNEIEYLLKKALKSQTKKRIKAALIEKRSRKLYADFIRECTGKNNDQENKSSYRIMSDKEIKRYFENQKSIVDIHLGRLKKFIVKTKKDHPNSKIVYSSLALYQDINPEIEYLYRQKEQKDDSENTETIPIPNSEQDKTFLKKSVILSDSHTVKKYENTARDHFDLKLEDLVNKSDSRNLENLLEFYFELYQLEILHEIGKQKLNPTSNSITHKVKTLIYKAIDRAIENNSTGAFYVLNAFVQRILILSIQKKSLEHFQEYISSPVDFYKLSYDKKQYNSNLKNFHNKCTEAATLSLRDIIRMIKDHVKNDKLNKFYYHAFQAFSQFLYAMVKNNDIKKFNAALNQYNIYLKQQHETYRRHVLLGIKSWIFYLYEIGKLSEDTTIAFIKHIQVYYFDFQDVLNDILFFRQSMPFNYMGWKDWDFTERHPGQFYALPNTDHWLTLGFMVDQLRENTLSYINSTKSKEKEENQKVQCLHDKLESLSEDFITNFDKWKSILKVESVKQLREKINKILRQINTSLN